MDYRGLGHSGQVATARRAGLSARFPPSSFPYFVLHRGNNDNKYLHAYLDVTKQPRGSDTSSAAMGKQTESFLASHAFSGSVGVILLLFFFVLQLANNLCHEDPQRI